MELNHKILLSNLILSEIKYPDDDDFDTLIDPRSSSFFITLDISYSGSANNEIIRRMVPAREKLMALMPEKNRELFAVG
jgi:hypothetical protein